MASKDTGMTLAIALIKARRLQTEVEALLTLTRHDEKKYQKIEAASKAVALATTILEEVNAAT